MPNASIYASIAQGASEAANYHREQPIRDARMQAAKTQQKLAEAQLQEVKGNAPLKRDTLELQLQQLQLQTRQMQGQQLKRSLFDSFRQYDVDGDVEHLNRFQEEARTNPVSGRFKEILRFDKLTKNQANDKLLNQLGIADLDGAYNSPEMLNNTLVATGADGTQKLVNVDKAQAGTGYTRQQRLEELQLKSQEATIQSRLMQGRQYSQIQQVDRAVKSLMEAENLPYHQAYEQVQSMGKGASRSGDMQGIKEIMSNDSSKDFTAATEEWFTLKAQGRKNRVSNEQSYIDNRLAEDSNLTRAEASREYANRTLTARQKNTEAVEGVKSELDRLGLFDGGLKEPEKRRKMGRLVANIEDLRGITLKQEEKRQLREFGSLINLARTVGDKLTDRETGLLDSTLSSVKTYMFNEVGGTAATSAYEAFRNSLRLAMSGTAVSKHEEAAFNKAAGTLKAKYKPVLSKFLTQMDTIRSKLQVMQSSNDEYITQFYLSTDLEELDDVIRGIESRIGLFNRQESGFKRSLEAKEPNTPRKPLDELIR